MIEGRGFLLTKQWRDTPAGVELCLWLSTEHGPVQLLVPQCEAVFFLPRSYRDRLPAPFASFLETHRATVKPLTLLDFSQQAIDGYYFNSERAMRDCRDQLIRQDIFPLEADINPSDRFLMERFVRGGLRYRAESQALLARSFRTKDVVADNYQPNFSVISLDIETAIDHLELYSIAVFGRVNEQWVRKVFLVSTEFVGEDVECFENDRELLIAFMAWLEQLDPDLIIGWNVINFDLWFLQQIADKYRLTLCLGRSGKLDANGNVANKKEGRVHWRSLDDEGNRRVVTVPGRIVLDGIDVLKTATYQFESFALGAVAKEVLGDSKLLESSDRGQQITELFLHDQKALVEYNLQDCKLVWRIFEHFRLIDFVVARTQMTGLALDRLGGSVAAFDYRYLPLLHRKGYVAPHGLHSDLLEASPGGLVLDSRPGIYRHVIVLDFKSLYPSIIRSFKIDPLGLALGLYRELDQCDLVPGFKGAWFAKREHILPGLIEELWQLRDSAKADNDSALSQAIKILMNSFYGVLGSFGCRFFDSRLASSITRRGHQIIRETEAFIGQQGWQVIYGDTDSVFVWLQDIENPEQVDAVGKTLAKDLNQWWSAKLAKEYAIDSALEIEFETHFEHFLMPTVRGSSAGSKKRYAGVVASGGEKQLVFKGLEAVRTDWTILAREFQTELYRRVFFDEPYRDYVLEVVRQLIQGDVDPKLVYRKRLRRRLADYQRNIPPHVQAAKKAAASGAVIHRGDWIEYLITVSGPEPADALQSRIDYQHYLDRQLAPIADGILHFIDDNFEFIVDRQLGLF